MKERERPESIAIEFSAKEVAHGQIKGHVMCWPVFPGRPRARDAPER